MSAIDDGKQGPSKLSIEDSREKRLARVKSKQRDRGGIFKPAETNPLIDILMSRDISGRSPSKAKRKSLGSNLKKEGRSADTKPPRPRKTDKRHKSGTPTPGEAHGRKTGKGAQAESSDVEGEVKTHKSGKKCRF